MALTQQQITLFSQRAKAAGLNDSQIQVAIAKKEAEMQSSGAVPTTQPEVITPAANLPDPTAQANQGNIVTNTVKAVVDPALKFGAFVGESVAQASRLGADKLAGKTSILDAEKNKEELDLLIENNMQVIKDMRAEKDPDKKRSYAAMNKALSEKIDALSNTAREVGNKQETLVMKDGKAISDRGKILETGVKRTAGAASYAIPGGVGMKAAANAGKLAVAGTAVANAASAGAIAGGLQGLGNSEGKDLTGTVVDTVTGATVGGATAGILSGAGQALKAVREARTGSAIGQKIANAGTEFKKSAYVKAAGRKPIIREGGDKLIDNMMKAGIKPGSPDELIHQADDILMDNAGVIFEKADEFRQKGVTIDKARILDPLQAKLANAPAKSKPVIQKVIDFVQADLDRFDEFTPAEAYAMKGDYGPFGNWTSTMDADAVTEANLWEEVYTNLNGLMDESFKKGGYEDFRAVNEAVSTAINTKKYAARSGNVAPNLNTLGLMDLLAGGAGLATGGGVMGLAAIGGKRVLNSPQFATRVGGALEKAGTSLASNSTVNQKTGSTVIGDILSKITQRGLVDASTGSGELVNNPNENSNSSTNEQTFDNNKSELNQITSPMGVNNADIVPQGSNHPIPKFRQYANKDQMIASAFADGLGTKDVQELVKLWDAFAPQSSSVVSPEVKTLIDQRKMLNDAGLSTASIDSKLEGLGFSASSAQSEGQKKFGPAVTRALTQLEDISGIGTKNTVFQGGSTTIGKSVKSVGIDTKKATDEKFAQKVNQYNSSLQLVVGAINQMLGAGTLNEGEAARLLDTMPNEYTSDEDAKAWFTNARMILGVK